MLKVKYFTSAGFAMEIVEKPFKLEGFVTRGIAEAWTAGETCRHKLM